MVKVEIEHAVPVAVAESLFIRIKSKYTHNLRQLIVGVIYRPMQSSIPKFFQNLTVIMSQLSRIGLPTYLAGDFNIDLRQYPAGDAACLFMNSIIANTCVPLVSLPIRVTSKSATLIDNMLSNDVRSLHCSSTRILLDTT